MTARKQKQHSSNDRLSNLRGVLAKLRELSLFAYLNDEEMRAVASLFEQTTASAGQQFVWRGGTDTYLYIIRSGRVFARRPDNRYTEEQLTESILHEGSAFNVDSFLTDKPNEHTFEAMDHGTTVWRVPRDGFLTLLQTHPTLRNNLNAPTLIAPSTVTPEEMAIAQVTEAIPAEPEPPAQGAMADHTNLPAPDAPFDVFKALSASGPFKGLDTATIKDIVQERTVITPKAGQLIVERGGINTGLFIVIEGRIAIREATDKYVDKLKGVVWPGNTANDVSFMTGRQNMETFEATNGLKAWVISREHWLNYQLKHPEIIGQLQPSDEIKAILMAQARHPWLNEGEVIMVYERKHKWTIVESIWLSVLIALVLLSLAVVLPRIEIGGINPYAMLMAYQVRGVSVALIAWVAALLYFAINIGLGVYDWTDDFYAVTDQRVVHQEKKLMQNSEFSGAPIEMIQNVTVNRKTLASVFLNMGDVDIDVVTSQGKIIFANITSPDKVAKAITTQQHQRMITVKAADRELRREQIRKQMEVTDRPSDVPASPKPKMNVRAKPLAAILDRLFGRNMKQWIGTWIPVQRMVVGDEIVYRKHWLDLIIHATLPFSLLLVFGLITAYALLAAPTLAGFLFGWPLVLPFGLITIVLLGWLFYQYEDWRNDFFVLGKDRVIDVDRKPFGISSRRNEASFDKIQNITSQSEGTINQLFNIGDVVIATGSAENELVWQRVGNPQRIQIEIMARIDALRRRREQDKIVEEYRRWAEWLGMYDELARVHERTNLKQGPSTG